MAQPGKEGLLAGGGVGSGKLLCKERILLCVKYWLSEGGLSILDVGEGSA